jgi:predicted membrane channel-forming protein YqfA (hemolysin III family)
MKRRKGGRLWKSIRARKVDAPAAPSDETRAAAEGGAESEGASKSDPAENRGLARSYLIAAAYAAVYIPALFYLRFGEVDAFALSFTGFVVVLCLLVALGYAFQNVPEYQAPVKAKGDWLDYVGGFWLVACAFGPLFGWLVAAPAFTLTEGNWWWRYAARVVLCAGLPALTALPLFRYVRGKYWYVMVVLLFGLSTLAAWSGLNTLQDLREGPVVRQTTGFYDNANNSFLPSAYGKPHKLTMLVHTGRTIKIEPAQAGVKK